MTSWTDKALCHGADPELFFNGEHYPEAKKICQWCPVIDDCLQAGLPMPYGVWGGTGPAEREKIRGKPYRSVYPDYERFDVTPIDAIIETYQKGYGARRTASITGQSLTKVRKVIDEAGLTRHNAAPQRRTDVEIQTVVDAYQEGRSIRETARHLGLGRNKTRDILRVAGVLGEGVMRNGKPLKRERILELHAQGWTNRQICEEIGCSKFWVTEVISHAKKNHR